ncbi:MAG: DUF1624 domain-containing protein [Polyangiaceae bacterium]|nr:DUF1624 domain-containing protein [Polyangiaceae bacterium]
MPSSTERSEPGLDVYRAVAVILMFVVHVRRIQGVRGDGPLEASLDLFMRIEPFIAASFLFIAGYSLVLSQSRAPSGRQWLGRMARRALALYGISVALFVLQYGVDLPDLLASSGILQAIGVSVIAVAACLVSPWPTRLLGLLLLAALGLGAALELARVSVSGLNGGPGGAVPILAFAAFGALVARVGSLGRVTLAVLVPFAIVLLGSLDWTQTHVSRYRDYGGEVAIVALLKGTAGAHTVAMPFWNHSVAGSVGLLLPLCLSLALALGSPARLSGHRVLAPLRSLGRHALLVYVLHLCVLGVLDATGVVPRSALGSWLFVLGLTLLLLLVVRGRESLARRGAAQKSPSVAR